MRKTDLAAGRLVRDGLLGGRLSDSTRKEGSSCWAVDPGAGAGRLRGSPACWAGSPGWARGQSRTSAGRSRGPRDIDRAAGRSITLGLTAGRRPSESTRKKGRGAGRSTGFQVGGRAQTAGRRVFPPPCFRTQVLFFPDGEASSSRNLQELTAAWGRGSGCWAADPVRNLFEK